MTHLLMPPHWGSGFQHTSFGVAQSMAWKTALWCKEKQLLKNHIGTFIEYLFEHLLSTYCVPGTVLGPGTCILSRVKEITSPGWMHETSAQGWCTGKTQRDGMGREVGGRIGMGNTCKSMADSCQCMAKTTTTL